MSSAKDLLIYFAAPTSNGLALLVEEFKVLQSTLHLVRVAAVYKRTQDLRQLKDSYIFTVGRFTSRESTESLVAKLLRPTTLLLCYDSIVKLDPRCPIPNVSLIEDGGILRCATEVWPDFYHPILEKSLSELSAVTYDLSGIEFVAQASSITKNLEKT